MTQLASDNFTRANDIHIGAGVLWWQRVHGDTFPFKILSNQAATTTTANDECELYNDGVISWPNDQYSQAALYGTGGTSGGTNGPGVTVRTSGSDSTSTYYRIVVSVGAGSNAVVLRKVVNLTFSSIGADVNVAWTTGQVMRVEIAGSTITTYRDGVVIDVRTDTAITSGNPGIAYSSSLAADGIDDWSGGDLGTTADTFAIASDADDGSGYKSQSTWASVPTGSWNDEPGDTLYVVKYVPGNYYAENTYLRWDTSSIPDDATIVSARLKIHLIARNSQFGTQYLEGDYFDFGGEPSVIGDWILTVGTSIFTQVQTTALSVGAVNTISLTDLTGINKTGYTGIRLAISNVTVVDNTQEVELQFAAREHATSPEAQLEVSYTTAAAPDAQPTRMDAHAGHFGPF